MKKSHNQYFNVSTWTLICIDFQVGEGTIKNTPSLNLTLAFLGLTLVCNDELFRNGAMSQTLK